MPPGRVTVNTSDVKSSVLYDSSLALLERRLDRRIAPGQHPVCAVI